MLVMAARSFEWAFIKRPLRKYEWPEGLDTPVERPLSVTNVLLDAFDLFFNQRGIGWSWSSHPFPHESTTPPIASVLAKMLLKFTVFDASQYILDLMSPIIDKTRGNNIVNASILSWTYMFFFCGQIYGLVESIYHVAMLIGRIFLRQPASHSPPLFRRSWMATSLREFWGVRWHQFFRHIFIVFGARPGGALLGRPGAILGAFTTSTLVHLVGPWSAGLMTVWSSIAGFFLFMGVGMILEGEFQRATGLAVRGWCGWLWTMAWILSWGSLLVNGGGWATRNHSSRKFPGSPATRQTAHRWCHPPVHQVQVTIPSIYDHTFEMRDVQYRMTD
jgi:hypothetical protein